MAEPDYESQYKDALVKEHLMKQEHRRKILQIHLIWLVVLLFLVWQTYNVGFLLGHIDAAHRRSEAAEKAHAHSDQKSNK